MEAGKINRLILDNLSSSVILTRSDNDTKLIISEMSKEFPTLVLNFVGTNVNKLDEISISGDAVIEANEIFQVNFITDYVSVESIRYISTAIFELINDDTNNLETSDGRYNISQVSHVIFNLSNEILTETDLSRILFAIKTVFIGLHNISIAILIGDSILFEEENKKKKKKKKKNKSKKRNKKLRNEIEKDLL